MIDKINIDNFAFESAYDNGNEDKCLCDTMNRNVTYQGLWLCEHYVNQSELINNPQVSADL